MTKFYHVVVTNDTVKLTLCEYVSVKDVMDFCGPLEKGTARINVYCFKKQ